MSERVDFYSVLGVDAEATPEQIHRAYRERVKACHPDRLAGLDADLRRMAKEKMIQLNEAHRVLRSAELRARYDATRRAVPAVGAARPDRDGGRPRPRAPEWNRRDRMDGQDLVVRAATEQFRTRVLEAGRAYRWIELDGSGLTLALDGRRGRRREVVLVAATDRLDQPTLVAMLRQFHSRTRQLGSSWWRREQVLGFASAVHFDGLERLKVVIDRFNESQADAGAPLRAAMVDLVSWTAAPGPRHLDDHLRFG
jgi:curved DNA-binding protein CbpA